MSTVHSQTGCPVVHFEVMGKDGPKLAEFYAKTFGWQIGERVGPQEYSSVDADPAHHRGVQGGIATAPDGYEGGPTFYIGVADMSAAFEDVQRNGGTHMMGPVEAPGGITIGYFRDPEGHPIGLVEIPPP